MKWGWQAVTGFTLMIRKQKHHEWRENSKAVDIPQTVSQDQMAVLIFTVIRCNTIYFIKRKMLGVCDCNINKTMNVFESEPQAHSHQCILRSQPRTRKIMEDEVIAVGALMSWE
jgi:hypothetical protein